VITAVQPVTNRTATLPNAFRANPDGVLVQCLTFGATDVINATVSTTQVTINRPGGSGNVDVYWEVEGDI
jgi:hypothetical protein